MRQTTPHTTMKICKIIIKDYQQFQDFELDLTYPEGHEKAGEPLEKVCLIGSNGTGKSTLLEIMNQNIPSNILYYNQAIVKYKINEKFVYCFRGSSWFSENKEENTTIEKDLIYNLPSSIYNGSPTYIDIRINEHFSSPNIDLSIYSPAESTENLYKNGIPNVTLDEALRAYENFPKNHTVSSDHIKDFWKLLIYLVDKRKNEFLDFQKQENNLDRTIREVKREFDSKSPEILSDIATLWNKILNKAGLEFDLEKAESPKHLNDNLHTYIKIKGSNQTVQYEKLSTGIRNFIFRVGHIFTLYFNRNIERGFLLLDEPENSLHPDFLYDLVDIYTGIIQNTQFFVATHNPIIAAQFEPYERFILEFDEQGAVHAKRGTTPVGDDPNDLLVQDFGVRNLLGKEGIKKWERYVELKNLIQREEDKAKKVGLLEEFLSIGQAYNFPLQ